MMKGHYGGMKEACCGQPSGFCKPKTKSKVAPHKGKTPAPRRHLTDGRKEKSRVAG